MFRSINIKMIHLLLVMFTPVTCSLSTKCGIVSNQFKDIPFGVSSAANHGMSFWWNWAKSPQGKFPNGTTISWKYNNEEYIPMMWGPGQLSNDEIQNLRKGKYLMGFNEPDLYGPPHCGEEGGSDYRPATSCGTWDVCFNPAIAAGNWKAFIDQVFPEKNFANGPKIISPAMALDAKGDASNCMTMLPQDLLFCPGWLKEFKTQTQKLTLVTSNSEILSYWDIIDFIQIHAYNYEPDNVIKKVHEYMDAFQEDVSKGKKIWLTELSGAYLSMDKQKEFMTTIIPQLNAIDEVYAYSWFSVWSFPSFVIEGKQPKTKRWISNLFKMNGDLNMLGKHYFMLCNAGNGQ